MKLQKKVASAKFSKNFYRIKHGHSCNFSDYENKLDCVLYKD